VVDRAGHYSFFNQCSDLPPPAAFLPCADQLPQERAKAVLRRWGTAFLLRYVAGDERYAAFRDPTVADGAEYAVFRTLRGTTAAGVSLPPPLPGGEERVARAVDLICQAGRAAACGALRSGRVSVQFAPQAPDAN